MSAYFTQHHFSPKWSIPHRSTHHHQDVPTTTLATAPAPVEPAAKESTEIHHTTSTTQNGNHDHSFAHFLKALNLHYAAPDDHPRHHDVVHPHFDMVETDTCYAVYGELPGLGREDVHVEANDHLFTLTITGELKRPVPKEAPAAAAAAAAKVTAENDNNQEGVGITHHHHQTEPAPAEPAAAAAAQEPAAAAPEVEATATTEPETPAKPSTEEPNKDEPKKPEKKETHLIWHVTERKTGLFKRVFRFPVELVEMPSVKASIHQGLLCVLVPKRKDVEAYNKKVEDARRVDVYGGAMRDTYPLFGYFF